MSYNHCKRFLKHKRVRPHYEEFTLQVLCSITTKERRLLLFTPSQEVPQVLSGIEGTLIGMGLQKT